MAVEIERKFLVLPERLPSLPPGTRICQGYIPTLNRTTVRVRTCGEKAFLTLKGPSAGLRRSEFEYAVPLEEAREMLQQFCGTAWIQKTRHEIHHEGMLWELDVFGGANAGLLVAEIELDDEAQHFTLPDWVGAEVSSDPRYSNLALTQNPFSTWT